LLSQEPRPLTRAEPSPPCGFLADFARLNLLPKFPGNDQAQKLLSSRLAHNRRESGMDRQTKHEIIIVTIASLAPIPLITAAVVAILS
jgi:hypothetical protein